MIRIEQFLFEENVDKNQAEQLMLEFPTTSFNTKQEFYDFFEGREIRLTRIAPPERNRFPEKQILLERFKNFKSSTDYDYIRQYIIEQRKIQDAIKNGDISTASTFLDSITARPVDPFFNFVIRKILTGSETGELPSENLRSILDNLLKQAKPEIDTEPDVTRDELNRIKSFDNYLKNRGSLRINVLDERFTIETFNYIVDRSFQQLEPAVNAERNVLKKAAEFSTLLPDDPTLIDENTLVQSLKKLITDDDTSVVALQSKLQDFQNRLNDLNSLVDLKQENVDELVRVIEELSDQRNLIVDETAIKDETIVALNEIIDSTLAELEEKVASQLENTADAFDALSTKIEEQAKKAEENSAKQLAAFEKAVGSLAETLKPKEPEPTPDNPAGDIIKTMNSDWDKVYVIPNSKYTTMTSILTKLSVKNQPPKLDYVYTPPAASNSFGSGQEINQILKWNDTYKSQFKSLFVAITDQKVANDILKDIRILSSNGGGVTELKEVIKNTLNEWSRDIGGARGNGRPIVHKAVLELNSTYKFVDDQKTAAEGSRLVDSTTDPSLLLRTLRTLSEINNVVDRAGDWLKIG